MRYILIRKNTGYVLCDEKNEPLGFDFMMQAQQYLAMKKTKPEQWRIARLVPAKP